MASAFIDSVSLSEVIGTTFSSDNFKPLRPSYPFDALSSVKTWNLNSNPSRGDKIVFTVMSALATNTGALNPTAYTYGSGKTNTKTRRTVTLDAYGDYSVIDSLELKAESCQNDVADAAWALADQAAGSLNLLARTVMDKNVFRNEVSSTVGSTYIQYGSSGTVGNMGPLRAIDIRKGVAALRANNVKPFNDGFYRCILHPNQYAQLRADSDNAGFTLTYRQTDVGAPYFAMGEVGDFEGVRFIVSSSVKVGTSTLSAYLMGDEFVGKAVGVDLTVRTGAYMVGPHENLLPIHWEFLGGYRTIRREAGIVIQTDVAAS